MREKRRNWLKAYGIIMMVIVMTVFGPRCYASAQQLSGDGVDEGGKVVDSKEVKILLVGNSLTRCVRDPEGRGIQEHLERLAAASGKRVVVRSVSFSGAALKNYVGMNPNRKGQKRSFTKALKSRKWDYVIIQERSNLHYKRFESESLPAMTKILEQIKKEVPDAQIMLYLPRGYNKKKIDAWEMECYIGAMGSRMESKFGISLIPVGMQFYRCNLQYPSICLMGPDKKHPTKAGYFLAASCVYQKIFGERPLIDDAVIKHTEVSEASVRKLIGLWGEGIYTDKVEVVLKKEQTYTMGVTDAAGNDLKGKYCMDATGNKQAEVHFTSLNEAVAVVDSLTGKITAVGSGMTVIVAETVDGRQAYCTVYVPYSMPKRLRAQGDVMVDADGNEMVSIQLKWRRQKKAEYEIYRSETKKGSYELIGYAMTNQYVDTSAKAGKTWYYKVRAVGQYEACASKMSKAIAVKLD